MKDMLKSNLANLKAMLGKKVLLLPAGNNARRGVNDQRLEQAVITKIGRVKVTLSIGSFGREETYRVVDYRKNEISSDHNAGYIVFAEEADYDKFKKANDIRRKLSEFFRSYGCNVESLTLKQLEQIEEIIFK